MITTEMKDGKAYRYINRKDSGGVIHCDTGAAIIYVDAPWDNEYWDDGKLLSVEEFVKKYNLEIKVPQKDGSSITYDDRIIYKNADGKYHRDGGPAYITPANKYWMKNGEYHREDGPAWEGDSTEWWINGKQLSKEEYNKEISKKMFKLEITESSGKITKYLLNGEEINFNEWESSNKNREAITEIIWNDYKQDGLILNNNGNFEFRNTLGNLDRKEGVARFEIEENEIINREYWLNGLIYDLESFINSSTGIIESKELLETHGDYKKTYKNNILTHYYKNQIHNDQGAAIKIPAIKIKDGYWKEEYWLEGHKYSFLQWEERTRGIRRSDLSIEIREGDKLVGHKMLYCSKKQAQKTENLKGELHSFNGEAASIWNGVSRWYKENKLHRDFGPASIDEKSQTWYKDGKKHRLDGPAYYVIGDNSEEDKWFYEGVEYPFLEWEKVTRGQRNKVVIIKGVDYREEWLTDGSCYKFDSKGHYHCDTGAAVNYASGNFAYYKHGKSHREGGPATKTIEFEKWYKDGLLHNEEGPAIKGKNITEYWLENTRLTFDDWELKTRGKRKNIVRWDMGTYEYREYETNGSYAQYLKKGNVIHGKSITLEGGDYDGEYFYYMGVLSNINGPAIKLKNGKEEFWFKGYCLSFEEWEKQTRSLRVISPIWQKLENGGYVGYYSNGDKCFVNENKSRFHREDGPAFISIDGNNFQYWIDGKELSKEEFDRKTIKGQIKHDGIAAMYRVGSRQSCKIASSVVGNQLKKNGYSKKQLKDLGEILDSEVGVAIISAMIGYGLLGFIEKRPGLEKFSKEFRVNAMATLGNEVFEGLSDIILPDIVVPKIEENHYIALETNEEDEILLISEERYL